MRTAASLACWALLAAPASAQVCLDCFTETLGANPFAAPVVLPGEVLASGTLGLAGPVENPSWLPNVMAKYGVRDGLELQGTLGYEPSLGLRGLVGVLGPVTVLGGVRGGYAYFRTEWLGQLSLPLLWAPADGWSVRLEPQATLNQITGNHLAVELALARLVAPGTTVAVALAPDYRLAEQIFTGSATLAVSKALTPRWATYALASVYVINAPVPLAAAGLTYLP